MPPPRHLSHGGVITVPGSYGFVVAVENKSVQGLVIKSPAYPYYTLPACKSHSQPETFLPMVLQGGVQETVGSVLKVEADSQSSPIRPNGGGGRSPHLPQLSRCLLGAVLIGLMEPSFSPDAFAFSPQLP